MSNHDEYIEAVERLALELNREPTAGEIEEEMADREAQRIDTAYEQRHCKPWRQRQPAE